MTNEKIRSKVITILAEQFGLTEAEIQRRDIEEEMDSLDGVELVMAMEEEFETEIPDELSATIKPVTIDTIVEALEKLLNGDSSVPVKRDMYPILSLQEGRLLTNVKLLPEALRQSGRAKRADAVEAADCLDHLMNMIALMHNQLVSSRTDFLRHGEKDSAKKITDTLVKLNLE